MTLYFSSYMHEYLHFALMTITFVDGTILVVSSLVLLRKYKNTLVDSGLYTFTRNPIYIGTMELLICLSLFSDRVESLWLVVAFWCAVHFYFIPQEEAEMKEKFGESYKNYIKKVKRWMF